MGNVTVAGLKAIIFSAGLGTRFKPWTDKHPKALAIINGKSLLQRNIEYLQSYGVMDVVVNIHYLAEQVIEAIEKNNGWGSNIMISDERNLLLETGGGLMHAKHFLESNQPFLSLNVDILTNANLNDLYKHHVAHKALVTFGVTNRISSRMLLLDDAGKLCGWRNKQSNEMRGPAKNWSIEAQQTLQEKAYSCVVVYEPTFFNLVRQTGKFSLIDSYLDLADEQLILGYDHSGDKLIDVGKPESVAIAEAAFE